MAISRSAWPIPGNGDTEYDNELLDAHFIAGDGRVNENIGLTAVHHVFHAEHNRLVEHTKTVVVNDAGYASRWRHRGGSGRFLNEWLVDDVTTVPASATGLVWDGERLFQAAKFGTEMQYQHLVFEEFARKVTPSVNVFIVPDGFDTTINPVDRGRVRPCGLSLRPLHAHGVDRSLRSQF